MTDGNVPPRSASGRRRAVADDARSWEVERGRSSQDAGEQGSASCGGVGRAKDLGQGECDTDRHMPDAETGMCDKRAGSHTARSFCRYSPKVGTVCGKAASTGLCGGRLAIGVPTATEQEKRRRAMGYFVRRLRRNVVRIRLTSSKSPLNAFVSSRGNHRCRSQIRSRVSVSAKEPGQLPETGLSHGWIRGSTPQQCS